MQDDIGQSDLSPNDPQSDIVPKTNENSQTTKKLLGETLVAKGVISKDQLTIALHQQKKAENNEKFLGSILIELGFLTESSLAAVLSETSGIAHLDAENIILDPRLIKKIPKEIVIKHKIIPISLTNDELTVAIHDIYNIIAIDKIKKHFDHKTKIITRHIPESQLNDIIEKYYQYNISIEDVLQEIETGISQKKDYNSGQGYVNPTVRLVDAFLLDGIRCGASDLHFEPEEFFVRLRYRIDGKLIQIRSFHKEYWAAIVVRIKIISGMNIAESRNPQDGRISYNIMGGDVDFRVASQPTIHGENIVMRILDKKKSLVPLEKLGFSQHNEEILKKLLMRPEGIIIVTGPTGSGKTTTLYSILNHINTVEKNIMTLEDPVEYQLSLIRQTNIREGAGMGFVEGIKSLMRQDPDIIFVGEMRDSETSTMALRAAMTGHQVFSTLHTNDAIGAISRLNDIGVSLALIGNYVLGVIAQRLVRKLCSSCKQPYEASEREKKFLGIDTQNSYQLYQKAGCEECGFIGYKGRIGVVEIFYIDKEIGEMVANGATHKALRDYSITHGFKTIADDGIVKIKDGVIDLKELMDTVDLTSLY